MQSRITACIVACAFLYLTGCGSSGPTLHEVTGKVTYDGEPIEVGEIIFEKVPAGSGVDAGGIKKGSFKVAVKDGTHIVRINGIKAFPLGPGDKAIADEKEINKQFLPKKYNADSTTQIEVHAPTKRDFELTSK